MANYTQENIYLYNGLSTDTKQTDGVAPSALFIDNLGNVDKFNGIGFDRIITGGNAHVIPNPIPASAGTIPIIYGANSQGKMQVGGGGTTTIISGDNPILGFNGFPAGTRDIVVTMATINSNNGSTAADLLIAAVNEGSIANYITLFNALAFRNPAATFYTAADQGVQMASWSEPYLSFHHSEADGDITDLGLVFADQSATSAGGTSPTYGMLHYW